MTQMDWKRIGVLIRKYLMNKYVVTLLAFLLVMLFAGDQSIVRRVHRARQIWRLEQQKEQYQRLLEEAQHDIQLLENKDSLERFAREQYFMHKAGEDVYLIED